MERSLNFSMNHPAADSPRAEQNLARSTSSWGVVTELDLPNSSISCRYSSHRTAAAAALSFDKLVRGRYGCKTYALMACAQNCKHLWMLVSLGFTFQQTAFQGSIDLLQPWNPSWVLIFVDKLKSQRICRIVT